MRRPASDPGLDWPTELGYAHWRDHPGIAEAVRASGLWRCHRCPNFVETPDAEVVVSSDGYVLLVRVPAAHQGHALYLELPPLEPEPIYEGTA